jgi:hypothetical protein
MRNTKSKKNECNAEIRRRVNEGRSCFTSAGFPALKRHEILHDAGTSDSGVFHITSFLYVAATTWLGKLRDDFENKILPC